MFFVDTIKKTFEENVENIKFVMFAVFIVSDSSVKVYSVCYSCFEEQ